MAKNSFVAKVTFNHPIITESVTPWWILVQKTEWIYVSISIYLSICRFINLQAPEIENFRKVELVE